MCCPFFPSSALLDNILKLDKQAIVAYLTTENLEFPSAVAVRNMEGLKPGEWVEDQILDFVLCYLSKLTGAGFEKVRIK